MSKINLLPWREARREQLKNQYFTNLGISVFLSLLLVGIGWFILNTSIRNQEERNSYLKAQTDIVSGHVKEIAELKKQRSDLIDRMHIIQSLQGNRPAIVHIFDQFVVTLPEGVFFTQLERKSNLIKIEGTAESNNRVSSLMRRLDNSEWFKEPNLTKVVANKDFGEQANDFNLNIKVESFSSNEEDN